jgi:uncharacterized protein
MLTDLVDYGLRTLPGLLVISAWWALSGRDPLLRIMALIFGFILIRDAMTPAGFWQFGLTNGAPWLRFTDEVVILLVFGIGSLTLAATVLATDGDLRRPVRWGRFDVTTVGLGIAGGVLAAGPWLLLAGGTPLAERGGAVAVSLLPALAFVALAGNLTEEIFFRGFLQGYLEQTFSEVRSALLSGLLFAAAHISLASTVTDVGWPLLLFTLYEGMICAFLRMYRGVIPAAIAHGMAIFVLASGLI